ncbi:hypothetical protein [Stigmatella hybrida]|uniref:hypothetical protein n=1 Tax=Stigmatella hybrida TaxID=394097 RepID=UPI001CDAD356|nr:hypothetical protein [Stigmatella hybrida]
MRRWLPCLVLGLWALPTPGLAGEVVYQFRSQEDAGATDPKGCDRAPFPVNVRLPAGLYAVRVDGGTARVLPGEPKRVGTGLACVRIQDRTFAEGSQADIFVRFELPEGRFIALGRCTMVSNAVPRAGVVLTTCALKLTEFPAAYAGGFISSASLFNPQKLPGFDTGSLWTLRVFEAPRPEGQAK